MNLLDQTLYTIAQPAMGGNWNVFSLVTLVSGILFAYIYLSDYKPALVKLTSPKAKSAAAFIIVLSAFVSIPGLFGALSPAVFAVIQAALAISIAYAFTYIVFGGGFKDILEAMGEGAEHGLQRIGILKKE